MVKLSIRYKLLIVILLVSLVPMLLLVVYNNYSDYHNFNLHSNSMIELNKSLSKELSDMSRTNAEKVILLNARHQAELLSKYLSFHPDWSIEKWKEEEPQIYNVAVSVVGKTGYTAIHDRNAINFFHPNPRVVGMDLHTLNSSLPDFWLIVEKGLDGSESCGYYNWTEKDGSISQKYMCTVPINGTNLILASTTYLSEVQENMERSLNIISRLIENNDRDWQVERNNTLIATFYVVGVIISLTILGAWFFSKHLLTPLFQLSKAMNDFTEGKKVHLKIRTNDELQDMAIQFMSMSKKINAFTKKLKSEVSHKTLELQKKVDELADNKAVLLSLMEDMEETRLKLEKEKRLRSDFLRNVSHELKTPLTIMKLSVDRLTRLEKGPKNMLARKKLGILTDLDKGISRFRGTILKILRLSRLELGEVEYVFEKTNVNTLIDDEVRNLTSLAKQKDLYLKTKTKKLPLIEVDREAITGVLRNLISNSLKFTQKGGVTITSEVNGKFVKITVADTGIGIPKKSQQMLFTKFYQVDSALSRRYGGTGIGLSICKGTVTGHGGKIWVDSDKGKGTKFIFTLPIKRRNKK